jgi:hypothetical protein
MGEMVTSLSSQTILSEFTRGVKGNRRAKGDRTRLSHGMADFLRPSIIQGIRSFTTQKVHHWGESIEATVGGFTGARTVQKVVCLGDEIWRETKPAPSADFKFLMS